LTHVIQIKTVHITSNLCVCVWMLDLSNFCPPLKLLKSSPIHITLSSKTQPLSQCLMFQLKCGQHHIDKTSCCFKCFEKKSEEINAKNL